MMALNFPSSPYESLDGKMDKCMEINSQFLVNLKISTCALCATSNFINGNGFDSKLARQGMLLMMMKNDQRNKLNLQKIPPCRIIKVLWLNFIRLKLGKN